MEQIPWTENGRSTSIHFCLSNFPYYLLLKTSVMLRWPVQGRKYWKGSYEWWLPEMISRISVSFALHCPRQCKNISHLPQVPFPPLRTIASTCERAGLSIPVSWSGGGRLSEWTTIFYDIRTWSINHNSLGPLNVDKKALIWYGRSMRGCISAPQNLAISKLAAVGKHCSWCQQRTHIKQKVWAEKHGWHANVMIIYPLQRNDCTWRREAGSPVNLFCSEHSHGKSKVILLMVVQIRQLRVSEKFCTCYSKGGGSKRKGMYSSFSERFGPFGYRSVLLTMAFVSQGIVLKCWPFTHTSQM